MTKEQQDDKVIYLPRNEESQLESDPEVANLLKTMRRIREDIPVNIELKEKLRRQFLNSQSDLNTSRSDKIKVPARSPYQQEAGKKEKKVQLFQWLIFLLPFIAVISGIFYFLTDRQAELPIDQPFFREERVIFYDGLGAKGLSAAAANTGKIYFISRGNLWEMNFSGQEQQKLLEPDVGQVFRQVAAAPNGNTLALVATKEGQSQLLLIDLTDSLSQKVLEQAAMDESFGEPAWSPDGSLIAFTKISSQGIKEVYKIDVNRPVINPEFLIEGSHPSWSPDGQLMAFERVNENNEPEIWLVDADGTGEVLWGSGGQPHWSGQNQLAFVHQRRWEKVLSYDSEGNPQLIADQRVQEIWVADLKGEIKINLTHLPGPSSEEEAGLLRKWEQEQHAEKSVVILKASVEDNHPRWAPDGSFLIVERNYGTHSYLLWVKAGGL